MAGNILFGGLIGVAVDAATGATQGSPPRKPKRGGGKSMICARENTKHLQDRSGRARQMVPDTQPRSASHICVDTQQKMACHNRA
jgi:hypothetical protein